MPGVHLTPVNFGSYCPLKIGNFSGGGVILTPLSFSAIYEWIFKKLVSYERYSSAGPRKNN